MTRLLGTSWPHAGGTEIILSRLAIDTGYEAPAVYAWARRMGGGQVVAVKGVVEIPKTSALQIDVGDRLFWDATNKVVNKTATAQVCVGIAVSAAANPSGTVTIKLGAVTPAGT